MDLPEPPNKVPAERPVLDNTIPVVVINKNHSKREKKLEKELAEAKKPVVIQRERGHKSTDEELLKNAKEALVQYDTARIVPQTGEFLEAIVNKMSVDELADVLVETLRQGRAGDKARVAGLLAKMIGKNEDDNPVETEDDVMKKADDQIFAYLENNFGLKKRGA